MESFAFSVQLLFDHNRSEQHPHYCTPSANPSIHVLLHSAITHEQDSQIIQRVHLNAWKVILKWLAICGKLHLCETWNLKLINCSYMTTNPEMSIQDLYWPKMMQRLHMEPDSIMHSGKCIETQKALGEGCWWMCVLRLAWSTITSLICRVHFLTAVFYVLFITERSFLARVFK